MLARRQAGAQRAPTALYRAFHPRRDLRGAARGDGRRPQPRARRAALHHQHRAAAAGDPFRRPSRPAHPRLGHRRPVRRHLAAGREHGPGPRPGRAAGVRPRRPDARPRLRRGRPVGARGGAAVGEHAPECAGAARRDPAWRAGEGPVLGRDRPAPRDAPRRQRVLSRLGILGDPRRLRRHAERAAAQRPGREARRRPEKTRAEEGRRKTGRRG